ncbi:glycosyltransferase involved in cell wall biosynthesis [Streptomyces achromogenes]|uniref:Glycosyltransferase involved in cell wall biosynthesis n=1 Tax=Streptomyces achromogenes TaxID=67255 RepID=A0ABU0QBW5_STRAH|nr:glycosyltransferase [Streptomyces achromogenes]MDQ0688122.1 glycosyltransferase involved in cell wall biosynthesis [Streptomyces achromogenes]MDQ0835319.1 glycosyltransferase involved in cell wall biosynthesis [Streptomyces achromogenes]
MPVKVSVIVPVYNPGRYIEDCIASLLGQSLPPDAYEIVFVDDGCTDATPALLDALAAQDSRVRVVHQENSGWPGKPRNVGIDAARGEYVMFVDADDHLGAEALERMYDYGVANDADVVVGKMAGRGRAVPVELFRTSRPRATVENAPLIDSLTPHKMIRRAFLERTGLRFPEGRRRLEDHVFVTEAYLRAGNVAVLGDYVCYYHVRRGDAANVSFQRIDPVSYFKDLREALDVVERYTEPGALRDRLFRRWLRVEMVERLRGRRFLNLPEDYRRELFEEIHGVVVERFGPGVAAPLQPTQRVVAALAADGRYDDVVAFARWEAGVGLAVEPRDVEWRGGLLRIVFAAELTHDGRPMVFPAAGERPRWPPRDVAEAVRWLGLDTAERFDRASPDLLLRERAGAAQYFQPVRTDRERIAAADGNGVRLVLRGTAVVDPATAVSGSPPREGLWDIWVRVGLGGWTKELRLGPAPRHGRPAPPAAVVADQVVLPYWTDRHAGLALDVGHASERLGLGRVAAGDVTLAGDRGERFHVLLPLHVPEAAPVLLRLTGVKPGSSHEVFGTLAPGGRLDAVLPVGDLGGRTWLTTVCLTPETEGARFHPLPFALHVDPDGVLVVPAPQPGGVRRTARRVRRVVYRALGRLTAGGRVATRPSRRRRR